MIDRMTLALRISHEMFTSLIPDELGMSLTIGTAGNIFRNLAQHELSEEDLIALFDCGLELSMMQCEDARIFYLAHAVYHVIQGETGAPKQ